MKILYIVNNVHGKSGWSRYAVDLGNEMVKLGHEVFFLTEKNGGSKSENVFPILGDHRIYIDNPLMGFIRSFFLARTIRKKIAELDPDVVHFITEPFALSLFWMNKEEVRFFYTGHGTYSYLPEIYNNNLKKKFARVLWSLVYKKMLCIITVSEFTKNHILKGDSSLSVKIRVVSNGVHEKFINEGSMNKVAKDDILRVISVGAIKPRKGILESIRAIGKFRDLYFNHSVKYYIVGDYSETDYYFKELKKTVIDLKLDENVNFLGNVSESVLFEKYRSADLFLLPTLYDGPSFEGFGLVYLEANAFGLPAIGSWGCGAESAIIYGKTGYLINPSDSNDIAEKIFLISRGGIKSEDCIEWAKSNILSQKAELIYTYYSNINRI